MTELLDVLGAFRDATKCPAVVWMLTDTGPVRLEPAPAKRSDSAWVPPLSSGPPVALP